ncbi:MAG: hypothetical protein ABI760_02830 [Ferruginibacter sp.]
MDKQQSNRFNGAIKADGFKGKVGAIDGPAPVVSGEMLFVNSGYDMFAQMPCKVLLAFEVDR